MPRPDAISCELHDYIEVACMYGYQVKLILKNEQTLEGKAIDITSTSDEGECLIIENDARQSVALTQLAKLLVITPNAKFKEVIFDD